MATVTGMTAAKMLEIQNASIVSGEIDEDDHLILTNYGGGEIDAGLVTTSDMSLAGNQTVTGIKTYNAGTLLDKGSMVYNVKAFGAVGNGTTDDTAALQAAVDAAHAAGGGTVWIPKATYKLATVPLKLYSGTTPTITAYSNITLDSDGAVLAQSTTGVDVIKALNDAANSAQSVNVTIRNLKLSFSGTATNSGHGLYLAQVSANGPAYMQWHLDNVSVNNCQGTGKYGFVFESLIVSTLDRCIATECAGGFWFNGEVGSTFGSVNTSVTMNSCYANMGVNGVNGYRFVNCTYFSVNACAADFGNNSAGAAYLIECGNSMSFNGCGFELGGANTLAAGFRIKANTGGFGGGQNVLTACYGFLSKDTKEVWIAGYGQATTVTGYQSNSSVSGSTGLYVEDYVEVTETSCSWSAATKRFLDPYCTWRTPGITRVQNFFANNAPAPAAGKTDFLFVGDLSGATTVGAMTGIAEDGQIMEIWYRDNGGAARAITHNAAYQNGPANLITTTVLGKNVREVLQYSSGSEKWVCMQSSPAGW